MALKSYRFTKIPKRVKRKKGSSKGLLRDATGAIIGLALFSEVASVVRRI